MPISRLHKRIRIGLLVFWLGFFGWLVAGMHAWHVEPADLESDDRVAVAQEATRITFTPRVDTASVGLVFLPGALVDPDAYAPLARAVGEAGYPVVILKLPYRLALRDADWQRVADRILALTRADPTNRSWILGGHSRGGSLASRFAEAHAQHLAGLLLIGTSHPREIDLSNLTIDVTKIYATEDGLASTEEVLQYAVNLPEHTHFVRIEGGNHTGFGAYGWQLGDRKALISREAQRDRTVEAVVAQLRRSKR